MPSHEEVERRVALLKKLKQTLNQQREKFHNYLQVLDKERDSLEQGKFDHLQTQVKLEEVIVEEIGTFQKVIDPLEDVWRQAYPESSDYEVEELKSNLAQLKTQVLEKNASNRSLLSSRMEEVRSEIVRLRPRPKNPYGKRAESHLIDIST
jgi:flagellar biosynthesis/type III secretory pathway chaperone